MNGLICGSFDPITRGHLDLIERAAGLCGHLYVVMGINSEKKGFFPMEQRLSWIRESIDDLRLDNVTCLVHEGVIIDLASRLDCRMIFKGVRNSQDFAYEQNLAAVNRYLDSRIETVLLFAREEVSWISSSNVRELIRYRRNIEPLVPRAVWQAVKEEYYGDAF